ncbi:Hypothetical protein R9X50_00469100 [Acrodontium crateriforme]|uniref:Zn(2)-C6 fungal-type domain-containing protein n=1 Tax=Acrodontium crateriforme TaxID=150365 RepID=A0AAQ3M6I9_9PEZI|nr:Hypothetical protein R9X50_00469100 [Acrodontium crateriforme]
MSARGVDPSAQPTQDVQLRLRSSCDLCYASKVKCSGTKPCDTCRRVTLAECKYSHVKSVGRPRGSRNKSFNNKVAKADHKLNQRPKPGSINHISPSGHCFPPALEVNSTHGPLARSETASDGTSELSKDLSSDFRDTATAFEDLNFADEAMSFNDAIGVLSPEYGSMMPMNSTSDAFIGFDVDFMPPALVEESKCLCFDQSSMCLEAFVRQGSNHAVPPVEAFLKGFKHFKSTVLHMLQTCHAPPDVDTLLLQILCLRRLYCNLHSWATSPSRNLAVNIAYGSSIGGYQVTAREEQAVIVTLLRPALDATRQSLENIHTHRQLFQSASNTANISQNDSETWTVRMELAHLKSMAKQVSRLADDIQTSLTCQYEQDL